MTEYELIHEWRFQTLKKRIYDFGLPQDSKVLEIGCYPMFLFRWLRQHFSHVQGICSSHEPVRDTHVIETNIDTEPLPFAKNSFDLVVLSEVIEHLLYGPERITHECTRILAPGGRLLISTPNARSLKSVIKQLSGLEIQISPDSSIYHHHNRELTRKELTKALESENSLINQSVEYISFYTPFRARVKKQSLLMQASKWAVYSAESIFPSLRDSLLATAKKRALQK